MEVEQIEKTEKLLEENGFKTLDTDALSAVEPSHYLDRSGRSLTYTFSDRKAKINSDLNLSNTNGLKKDQKVNDCLLK